MNRRPGPGPIGYGHHRLGLLLLVLGVIAIAALTAYLVVSISRRKRHGGPWAGGPRQWGPAPQPWGPQFAGTDRALDLARARYAQGELTRDAYLQMVSDLGGRPLDAPAPPPPTASTAPTAPAP